VRSRQATDGGEVVCICRGVVPTVLSVPLDGDLKWELLLFTNS